MRLAQVCRVPPLTLLSRVPTRVPAAVSWYDEFQRLYDTIPCVEVQALKEHNDQVLHLSFSHSGCLFASCSKDCTVKVKRQRNPSAWL